MAQTEGQPDDEKELLEAEADEAHFATENPLLSWWLDEFAPQLRAGKDERLDEPS